MVKLLLTILVICISLLFTPKSQAGLGQSRGLEPCMKASCVAYFEKWQSLAKRKHARAISALAELYYQGYGTNKDLEMSFKNFRLASTWGFAYAQYRTALFYLNEEGFIDYERGVSYLRKAARGKNSESYFLLAVIYASEDFGFLDIDDSDNYLAKAISAKHVKAQQYVELLINNGKLDLQSYPKTLHFVEELKSKLNNSTNSNNTESQNLVNNSEIQWARDSDIEVITVSVPSLDDIFDHELALLNRAVPDAEFGGSVSKLRGRTCEDMPFCANLQIKGDHLNQRIFDLYFNNLGGVAKIRN